MDINKFIQFEHKAWQKKSLAYSRYFELLTPQTLPAILENVTDSKDSSALDLACGPGYIANGISRKVGHVTGIDFSSTMIDIARSKYKDISFEVGNAEKLELADSTFDYVIINFGVLHFGNPKQVFSEIFRVLKPKGKLMFTVWCPASESLGMEIIYSAITKFANTSLIPEGPDFFRYVNPETVKSELEDIGFSSFSSQKIDTHWIIEDHNIFINAYIEGGARLGSLIELQQTSVKQQIREYIAQRLEKTKVENLYRVPVPSLLWVIQ